MATLVREGFAFSILLPYPNPLFLIHPPSMPAYRSPVKPFAKQARALAVSAERENFALFMEMGTGKSKIVVDTAGMRFASGDLDSVLVVCPNGLQRNWADEFKTHCGVPFRMAIIDDTMRKKESEALELLLRARHGLRVLAVHIDSLRTIATQEAIERFIEKRKFMMAVDESHRIKSMKAAQTKIAIAIGREAMMRRILSGTSTPNSPVDLYAQFQFLSPKILRFENLTAYRRHFCELIPPNSNLVKSIAAKTGRSAAWIMIQKREPDGTPIYKNLDQLQERIAPYVFRARKEECVDLPPKLYEKRTITLAPAQRRAYDAVRKSIIAEFVHDGRLIKIDSALMITRLTRLAQIAGNHFSEGPKMPAHRLVPSDENPRMRAVIDILEDAGNPPTIIWARHSAEIKELSEVFKGSSVTIDGSVPANDRFERIKAFQEGQPGARILIGQVALGIGFNATAAKLIVYYSNDFSLEHRLQSEDRAHRAGLKHPVTIVDIEAVDTLDGKIIKALRDKREISDLIAGDPITQWI